MINMITEKIIDIKDLKSKSEKIFQVNMNERTISSRSEGVKEFIAETLSEFAVLNVKSYSINNLIKTEFYFNLEDEDHRILVIGRNVNTTEFVEILKYYIQNKRNRLIAFSMMSLDN